jgi:hypothetical protein
LNEKNSSWSIPAVTVSSKKLAQQYRLLTEHTTPCTLMGYVAQVFTGPQTDMLLVHVAIQMKMGLNTKSFVVESSKQSSQIILHVRNEYQESSWG